MHTLSSTYTDLSPPISIGTTPAVVSVDAHSSDSQGATDSNTDNVFGIETTPGLSIEVTPTTLSRSSTMPASLNAIGSSTSTQVSCIDTTLFNTNQVSVNKSNSRMSLLQVVPKLEFVVDSLFCIGSPIALFLTLKYALAIESQIKRQLFKLFPIN
jgi:hypothetical protein